MKRFKELSLVLGILVLASYSLCWAQDIDLEKIVVTPSRIEESYGDTSRKVDVITSKDIESSGAKDIAEVLTEITSANISEYGGLGASKNIRMRGSTAAQVLVLVDGRPINNPRDGEADLSTIPLDNISRVEVMHGPASSLYGAGAMGGTVNIITKKPPKEKQKTGLYTGFGTYRTYTEYLSHGARVGKLGYLITGGYQSSEGFRNNSKFNAKDLNAKIEYEFNDNNNLTINSGFYKSRAGAPGPITYPDPDDKQNILKNFLDLNWQFKPTNTIQVSTKIYENYDRLEFLYNGTSPTKDIHATKVRGLDLQYNQKITDIYQLICGFNYVANLNDSTVSAKHKYIVRAGYLENQLDLLNNLSLNISARVDDYSNFSTRFNPSFSFLYKLSADNKLHGSVSRSFRAPTFNDLYWPKTDYVVEIWEGNPNLKPEKGITYELGFDTQICKFLSSGITYYRSDYKDLINWSEEGITWAPRNVSSAVIDGIEFENKIFLPGHLEFDLNYTFLKAKDKDTHKYLVYQPKDKLDFSLKLNEFKGFLFELKGQFTDKRFHDAENTITVKRFFVLGLNLTKKFRPDFTYFMSINNLLAKKYQVIRDRPMPGFSITNGMKLEF